MTITEIRINQYNFLQEKLQILLQNSLASVYIQFQLSKLSESMEAEFLISGKEKENNVPFEEEEEVDNSFKDQNHHDLNTGIMHYSLIDAPIVQQADQEDDPQSNQERKSTLKNSVNHNFQKHLVISCKKMVTVLKNSQNSISYQVAQKMWRLFANSKEKSKKIFYVLFGEANYSDNKFKEIVKNMKFQEFLTQYTENTFRHAQQILREIAIEQLTEECIRQNIERRRGLKSKKEFYVYFMDFMEQLKQGPLNKLRINDRTSKKIEERIRTDPTTF